jgi:periplasmic copper chaperone A
MSFLLPTMAIIAATLAACGQNGAGSPNTAPDAADASSTASDAAQPGMTEASLRLNANPSSPSSVTFALNGGPSGKTIVGVTSPDASRVEMHETRSEGGMVSMIAVESIAAAANTRLAPRERGTHLMLFDVSSAAREAGKVRLTVRYADGTTGDVEAIAVAEPAAAGEDHSGH